MCFCVRLKQEQKLKKIYTSTLYFFMCYPNAPTLGCVKQIRLSMGGVAFLWNYSVSTWYFSNVTKLKKLLFVGIVSKYFMSLFIYLFFKLS